MKHPFQVGDLVRSRNYSTNIALVTNTHKCQTGLFVDVVWLHTGKHVPWYDFSRFTLISRAEQ